MDNEHFHELEEVSADNFWFKAKEYYLHQVIKKNKSVILDVGCGSGRNMLPFIALGHDVLGIDINEYALELCKSKGYRVFRVDLQKDALSDIHAAPDYITALDFMEHIENPVEIMSNLRSVAKPDTRLIVTVPAYRFLYSSWDKALGHVKRYDRSLLCRELEEGGWHVELATYAHFLPLIPAILQRKFLGSLKKRVTSTPPRAREKFFNPPPLMNRILYFLYYPEFLLFRAGIYFPLGLSVLAIAVPAKRKEGV